MKRLYWLLLLLILMLAACGGATAEPIAESNETVASNEVETAENAETITNSEAGFSITLPDNWTSVEPSAAAFAQIGDTVGQGEALAHLTDAYVQALLASGLEIYALNEDDASLNSAVPVSIQIIRRDAPVSLTLAELVNETAVQLESILDLTTNLEQAPVTLSGSEAIQLRYTMQAQTAVGGSAEVHNTQYYLINNSALYIITIEMARGLVSDYLMEVETAVETFQLSSNE
ncbi:hypothetical protein [Candidatus Leptofilum sp.]|uniref:hypothetical protein n=1 Tax=Candidatus Leptofilum sp. TaxID=3241576 RepID=UPI003B5A4742